MTTLEIIQGESQTTKSSAGMHAALNFLSLPFQNEAKTVLFCRSKRVLSNHLNGFIEINEKFPSELLKKVGIKYLEVDEIFLLLLHLHLSRPYLRTGGQW